jgi:hypothetical protein
LARPRDDAQSAPTAAPSASESRPTTMMST